MILLERIRKHRANARQARAIDRAVRTAPSRAARDEIIFFAQRRDL
jgi:hypothetical protein